MIDDAGDGPPLFGDWVPGSSSSSPLGDAGWLLVSGDPREEPFFHLVVFLLAGSSGGSSAADIEWLRDRLRPLPDTGSSTMEASTVGGSKTDCDR